jgi:ABC-type phosphate transport system substrate-binding protein
MKTQSSARLLSALTFFLVISSSLCAARDVAVIVDKRNSLDGVSGAELSKMLRAGVRKWPDGRKVVVVVKDASSADMKMVLDKVPVKGEEDLKSLAAAHPGEVIVVDSDQVLLKAVETNPGAIGLINVYSITSGVKVLKIDGKLPLEPGYLLHGNN